MCFDSGLALKNDGLYNWTTLMGLTRGGSFASEPVGTGSQVYEQLCNHAEALEN